VAEYKALSSNPSPTKKKKKSSLHSQTIKLNCMYITIYIYTYVYIHIIFSVLVTESYPCSCNASAPPLSYIPSPSFFVLRKFMSFDCKDNTEWAKIMAMKQGKVLEKLIVCEWEIDDTILSQALINQHVLFSIKCSQKLAMKPWKVKVTEQLKVALRPTTATWF
jgi:hypothetical protein